MEWPWRGRSCSASRPSQLHGTVWATTAALSLAHFPPLTNIRYRITLSRGARLLLALTLAVSDRIVAAQQLGEAANRVDDRTQSLGRRHGFDRRHPCKSH